MKVNSIEAAWKEANKLFPTDYDHDISSSERAGYPVYRSTAEGHYYDRICDLGCRLEIVLDSSKQPTVNIWIEEEPEQKEEPKMEKITGNGCSYIIYISKDHDKVSALHTPMLALKSAHKSIDGWHWCVSTVEVLQDCRIPSIYHGNGLYATLVEHNNGDWGKAPTYEIHVI